MSVSSVKIFSGAKKSLKSVAKKCNPSKILKNANKSKTVKDVAQKAVPAGVGFDPVQIIAGVLLGATGMGVPTVVAMNSYSDVKNHNQMLYETQKSPQRVGVVYSTTA